MLKKLSMCASILGLILAPAVALAKPDFELPANAKEVAPNVFSLGQAYDKNTDSMVEGLAFVHKKGNAKNAPVNSQKTPACYGFLADGAKWKVAPEPWTVFGTGSSLDVNFLLANTSANIAKWEGAAQADILGLGSTSTSTPGNTNVLDNKNQVSFAKISNSNTIAVTTVWGTFSGPTQNRKLVEWDQVFNTDYAWSANALLEPNKMDFENISTHELGHAVGMDDIYNSSCSTVTMYGYATEGDINKRSLEKADITGISTLY